MTKAKIKEMPSDTSIPTLTWTLFVSGGFGGKDVVKAGWKSANVVDANMLVGVGMLADAGMLDKVGKVSVKVKAVVVPDSLAIGDGEVMLMALASLRSGPWSISTTIALSQ